MTTRVTREENPTWDVRTRSLDEARLGSLARQYPDLESALNDFRTGARWAAGLIPGDPAASSAAQILTASTTNFGAQRARNTALAWSLAALAGYRG